MRTVADPRHLTEARLAATLGADDVPVVARDTPLPPGPRWPVLLQSVFLFRFRHLAHPWLHRRYGDVFTVRLLPGGRTLVLFSRPEHVREIFAADPAVFHAGKGNAILGPVMGRHSLLLQDGAEHHRARKLLMPAFNGHALHGYEALVQEVARTEVGSWPTGIPVRSLDRMNELTLEVILRVVFGVTDENRLARLRPLLGEIVRVSPAVLLGWGRPALTRLGPWRRMVQNQYAFDELIFAEIAERRQAADLAERSDVLSRLILAGGALEGPSTPACEDADALDDVELRDQLVTLLLAGHETTAAALAWSLYELGRAPELLRRARKGDQECLEAVLKEAMRLHPIIPMVVRTLVEPATIAGIDFPAGVTVGPSIVVAHRRHESFPDAERFRPERFLGQSPAPGTWIPSVEACAAASAPASASWRG